MTLHYSDDTITVHAGDCLDVMAELADNSIDAVITDPPYGIGFMGKEWDGVAIREAATRDRETRKSFGPESASRPGRALPRSSSAYGNEAIIAGPVSGGREFQDWCQQWATECLRLLKPGGHLLAFGGTRTWHRLAAAIEDAGFEIRDSIAWLYGSGFPKSLDVSKAIDKGEGHWRGRAGVVASLNGSMSGGNYERTNRGHPVTDAAKQWQGWGTALKPAFEPIVVARKPIRGTVAANVTEYGTGALNIDACRIATTDTLTGSGTPPLQYGGANSRPFHEDAEPRGVNQHPAGRWPTNVVIDEHTANGIAHPTVKPLDLMRWLVRLVTPPAGVILDPFAGSGTTAEAAIHEHKRAIVIEREPDYLPLIVGRLSKPMAIGFDFETPA